MGEFSFRSASAMNINLSNSLGSLRQNSGKVQHVPSSSKGAPVLIAVRGLASGDASCNRDSHTYRPPTTQLNYRNHISVDSTKDSASGNQVNTVEYERDIYSPSTTEFPTLSYQLPDKQLGQGGNTMKGHDQPSLQGGREGYLGLKTLVPTPQANGDSCTPFVNQVSVAEEEDQKESLSRVRPQQSTSGNRMDFSSLPSGYRFHVQEMISPELCNGSSRGHTAGQDEEHPFSVSRDVRKPDTFKKELKIFSAKGTVRGYKNRVKAGIATFLQQQDGAKNYRVLEKGKIVLYTTNMMIVRSTYEKCIRVRKILQNHMVQYEERDIFMSQENQRELRERLEQVELEVPQVFADGQHLGGADELTFLNETGELRQIFTNFKKVSKISSCELCGGYRFIPCTSCHGSKKSLHRNHFTAEFCALRCIICDENGLIKCDICAAAEH